MSLGKVKYLKTKHLIVYEIEKIKRTKRELDNND